MDLGMGRLPAFWDTHDTGSTQFMKQEKRKGIV